MPSNLQARNSTIKTLSVGDSTFGDAGFQALAEGLAANHSLTSLDAEKKVRNLHTCLTRIHVCPLTQNSCCKV